MRKTKDIRINDDYKVRFELEGVYCTATLMHKVILFWGWIKYFESTNYDCHFKFTFDTTKHDTQAELVQYGRFYTGNSWINYDVMKFNFKDRATSLYNWYNQSLHEQDVKGFQQEVINKIFE